MRLVTAEEMKEIDRRSISDFGIPGLILMENAGIQATRVASEMLRKKKSPQVVVVAGTGNNGGDGFVIARHLINSGTATKVYLAGKVKKVSGDARTNLNILLKMGQRVEPLNSEGALRRLSRAIKPAHLVVDALLGTGTKGEVKGIYKKIVSLINRSAKLVLAVDVPSGLNCNNAASSTDAVCADTTVTFGLPKQGFFSPGAKRYLGKIIVADISIPQELLK